MGLEWKRKFKWRYESKVAQVKKFMYLDTYSFIVKWALSLHLQVKLSVSSKKLQYTLMNFLAERFVQS